MKHAPSILVLALLSCRGLADVPDASWAASCEVGAKEKHFKWLRQLTTGGVHAEAYWSPDGRGLILQAVRPGDAADQIYTMDLATGAVTRVSNGEGKCT